MRIRDQIKRLGAGLLALGLGLSLGPAASKKPGGKEASHSDKPAKIKVSEKRGFHPGPIRVTLSTDAAEARIYYTTDGRVPNPETGSAYESPLSIGSPTVLRSAAFRQGRCVSEIDTHTFLLVPEVLRQTGAGWPAQWGTNQNWIVPAAYAMDSKVVEDTRYRAEMPAALRALPSLSIVLDPADLLDPARGLYTHPRESGEDWERPASLEYIPSDGKGLQVDCGLRIQGGWNRRPEESPKHAFRVVFRKKYGPGKLKHPLFEEPGTKEFDTLILRAGCNNTWLHWSGVERAHGDYIRDEWMRETHAAMGHPAARGRFVHLYLNSLYWGIYDLTERPDTHLAADHFGGAPEDYDARNGENILSGDDVAWKKLMALANGGATRPEVYQQVEELLDVPAFIDFMILNLYGANADWDRASNWYAARRRQPPGSYQFFVWDGERTLERVDSNSIAFDDDQSPPRLFQKLRQNEEFRVRFGDQAQRHLGPGGALNPPAAAARFDTAARVLESAIICESARWGDYRREVHPYKEGPFELYTRDHHWRPEIQRLLRDYFPARSAIVLQQFRDAGLFPQLNPPAIQIEHGQVRLSSPGAEIWVTDDATDPRMVGGAKAPSARLYEKPLQVVPGKIWMRARRMLEGKTEWSALVVL